MRRRSILPKSFGNSRRFTCTFPYIYICMCVCVQSKGRAENSWKIVSVLEKLQCWKQRPEASSIFPASDVRDNYRFARILNKQDCRSQIPFLPQLPARLFRRPRSTGVDGRRKIEGKSKRSRLIKYAWHRYIAAGRSLINVRQISLATDELTYVCFI